MWRHPLRNWQPGSTLPRRLLDHALHLRTRARLQFAQHPLGFGVQLAAGELVQIECSVRDLLLFDDPSYASEELQG